VKVVECAERSLEFGWWRRRRVTLYGADSVLVAVGWGTRVLERCGIYGPRNMGLMAQVYVGLDALLLWFPLFLKLMGHEARAFKFYIQNFNYFLP